LAFYRAIREGAGDALVLGCNVIGHLAAGLIEIQRTGDDTSGRDWNRTRKMGINTLAFRMPQHEAFFAVDADCVGLTRDVPWALNDPWLDLLARSGTPLFVSAAPDAVGPDQLASLKQAFASAAVPQPAGEPLDWLDTTCPSSWRLGGDETVYDWYSRQIASPAVP
jgi:alpha-galactosidase